MDTSAIVTESTLSGSTELSSTLGISKQQLEILEKQELKTVQDIRNLPTPTWDSLKQDSQFTYKTKGILETLRPSGTSSGASGGTTVPLISQGDIKNPNIYLYCMLVVIVLLSYFS